MLSFISAGYYTHQGLLSWLNEELSDNFKESLACDISNWLWEVFSRLGLKQGKVRNFPHPFFTSYSQNKPFFKKKNNNNVFLIGRYLLYNIALVSYIHQSELAIGIHMSPPS